MCTGCSTTDSLTSVVYRSRTAGVRRRASACSTCTRSSQNRGGTTTYTKREGGRGQGGVHSAGDAKVTAVLGWCSWETCMVSAIIIVAASTRRRDLPFKFTTTLIQHKHTTTCPTTTLVQPTAQTHSYWKPHLLYVHAQHQASPVMWAQLLAGHLHPGTRHTP